MVGIFWFVHQHLVFKAEKIEELVIDELGLVDSSLTHIAQWEKHKIYRLFSLPFDGTEYQQFPRGRVIFDTKKCIFNICLDQSILTEQVKSQVVKAFKLDYQKTHWFTDDHYQCF